MIDVVCRCGKAASYPESKAGTVARCDCGNPLLLACAESLPEDAGGGDFDAQLVLPGNAGQVFLGGVAEIVIGSLPTSHIRLGDKLVSRSHCKLVRVDFGPSRWKVVDNGSRNGTFVNGERVTEAELQDGDELGIGNARMRFARVEAPAPATAPPPPPPPLVTASAASAGGPVCPSCNRTLAPKARFCTDCGIDIKTGRALALSHEFDENDLAIRADTWIRLISWIVPLGLFPVASEALGLRKPVVTWVITAITVLSSILFFIAANAAAEPSASTLNLMMWTGTPQATAGGEDEEQILQDLQEENRDLPASKQQSDRQLRRLAKKLAESSESIPEGVGFRWYQPLTAALLHGDLMHLAGNILFLIVFGMRVNELIGNLKFAIIYPLLAVTSGWAYMLTAGLQPPHPMLGASGAIMGLAGMYFIFFPIQKVHMAAWFRIRFWYGYKVFRMRGFWLLLMWIGLNDVLPMFFGLRDGVAHWAHFGGFASGVAIAVLLMVTRMANARGTDLLSTVLGKRAWAILGKPSVHAAAAGAIAAPPEPVRPAATRR